MKKFLWFFSCHYHFLASLNALPPYTATIKCFSEIFYEKFSMNFLNVFKAFDKDTPS